MQPFKLIIEQQLMKAFEQAFPSINLTKTSIEVTRATHARFGHYQCNSAMKLTKQLQLAPREIASQVTAVLSLDPIFAGTEIAGPGFINLTLTKDFIGTYCQQMVQSARDGLNKSKIIIDFSSPNVAKEMHVGHLRSTIIGDCLARLFEYLGAQVLRLNHIGDWGTSFGMLIAYIKQSPELLAQKTIALATLGEYYKAAKKRFDSEPTFKKQSQLEVVNLQQGEAEAIKIWQIICQISSKAYQAIYQLLDVHLIERGESFYNPFLPEIIDDLEKKQLLAVSDGAKCLFLEGFANRQGQMLPFIVQKSDGGYNYATTDLAAIRHRVEVEKGERLIYVTDAGQATHFAMLFAAARKAGYLPSQVKVDHVAFGLVLGADGKKFKTRSGDSERLIDLLTTAIEKAKSILHSRNEANENNLDDIESMGTILGINAVKYADLACHRINDYSFSYERMLKFEGNTAAFLMYSFVRIQSIKRRVVNSKVEKIALEHPSEIELGLHLCQFWEILCSIADDLMPHRLCEYLYELAGKFNLFFRDCRVEGSNEQNQRIALCELTASVLHDGLTILGLRTVDKM